MARLKRILRHPAAAVVLLVLLGVSVWSLPKEWYGGSAAGSWIGSFYMARPTVCRYTFPRYLLKSIDGWSVLDPRSSESDADAVFGSADFAVTADYLAKSYETGLYAPSILHRSESIMIHPLTTAGKLTDGDLAEARRVYLDWLIDPDGGGMHPLAVAPLRRGNVHQRSIIWSGWLHNALALAAVIGLSYSFWWNTRPAVWWARSRAGKIAMGECPACGYDLHGLSARQCPECGEEWPERDMQNPPMDPSTRA